MEQTRIVGGEDIDITEAPYQVSLVNRGMHSCGGSIVANDLILTAAHCVRGSRPENFQIRVGSSILNKGGELYPVGEIIWHPDFEFSKMNKDIAVMWLSEPLRFSDEVMAIPMLSEDVEIEEGEETTVTGWGAIEENGIAPKMLQRVEVPIVSQENCQDAYSPMYNITNSMLCAGLPSGGKDACQGDSGGPLVYEGQLAGVVSWGLGCARPRYPGVYAKVSDLRPWIDNSINYLRQKHILRGL
ncbi:vitellin-degrading protease-like isoform X3 [Pectinophora gossypiella]|nr:vitellin-degrading protease-like isoform X3 [Pectinophora gossypiella]